MPACSKRSASSKARGIIRVTEAMCVDTPGGKPNRTPGRKAGMPAHAVRDLEGICQQAVNWRALQELVREFMLLCPRIEVALQVVQTLVGLHAKKGLRCPLEFLPR